MLATPAKILSEENKGSLSSNAAAAINASGILRPVVRLILITFSCKGKL